MRKRLLLIAALVLTVAGTASAAHPKSKVVRVVKREGAFTATLTYLQRSPSDSTQVLLRIRRRGTIVLRRKICLLDPSFPIGGRCEWRLSAGPSLSVARVGPGNKPAFLVDAWNGGNHCCTDTFIAIPGQKVAWLTREWAGAKGWSWYRIRRVHDQRVFVTGDGRFFCVFSMCAGASVPIRVFTIDAADRFVNVTSRFPALIRGDARRQARSGGMTIEHQGSGVLAAWCGDEYLLGKGRHCARVLAYAVKHHRRNMGGVEPTRAFVHALNRDLKRWGYTR